MPVINKVGGSVDRVNGQLDKVDKITDSAVDAADSVDTAIRAVSMAVTKPVQKVSGLAAGVSFATADFKSKHDWRHAVAGGQGSRRAPRAGAHRRAPRRRRVSGRTYRSPACSAPQSARQRSRRALVAAADRPRKRTTVERLRRPRVVDRPASANAPRSLRPRSWCGATVYAPAVQPSGWIGGALQAAARARVRPVARRDDKSLRWRAA